MVLYPNAKINIGLNVVEKRSDGYHNIETVFYPIDLLDELKVELSTSDVVYRLFSKGIKIGGNTDNNLVIKALQLIKTKHEIPPLAIFLKKNIPFGAGLGGGSADAAFMLKLLNNMFNLKISTEQLEVMAAKIGADCPVFIQNKPVFATGIGNEFTPLEFSLKGYWLLLIKPDIYVSTPLAYAGVTPSKPKSSLIDLVKEPISEWRNLIFNDFEKSVFLKHPEIEHIKENLYKSGAKYASMSGSGSSVYGIFEKPLNLTNRDFPFDVNIKFDFWEIPL
ncbi:MAG: 4-(cytidine 5'-diphospho)-2-C-methyl-D-erythritol kinase [Porphyromonadaceae bacterium]|jgi:4-diphosphocytidyl-2-C-methyl-D-erythritol kinase|nr:4-(cytidine 5'-diphospho)-2-C-methyl-D-erythritol kinase [Porphyromonadaceae bacterium]